MIVRILEGYDYVVKSDQLIDALYTMRFEEMDFDLCNDVLMQFPFEKYNYTKAFDEIIEYVDENYIDRDDIVGNYNSFQFIVEMIEKEVGAGKEAEKEMKDMIRSAAVGLMNEDDIRSMLEVKNGKVMLYRCISLEKKDLGTDITIGKYIQMLKNSSYGKKYTGVGKYWGMDANHAIAHWGGNGQQVVLVVMVDDNQIDWMETMEIFFTDLWQEEKEIRLKENQKIWLAGIIGDDDDNTIHPAQFYIRV